MPRRSKEAERKEALAIVTGAPDGTRPLDKSHDWQPLWPHELWGHNRKAPQTFKYATRYQTLSVALIALLALMARVPAAEKVSAAQAKDLLAVSHFENCKNDGWQYAPDLLDAIPRCRGPRKAMAPRVCLHRMAALESTIVTAFLQPSAKWPCHEGGVLTRNDGDPSQGPQV